MKSLVKPLLVLLVLLPAALAARTQDRTVTGTVSDPSGEPLPGVAVVVKGSARGVLTDNAGAFSLSIPDAETVLQITLLGYSAEEVTVAPGQNRIAVTLREDALFLNETVVVGYGVAKKVNLTGAISTVDTKSLENRSSHSLSHMLQGSVPGLNISTATGHPGSSASLNIRGYTSINGAEPLVLIDGAVGDLGRVNADDVASISVIKDAAAAAVYGARAAFGVILVTTKSGSESDGKTTVRYSGRWGWEAPTTSTDYETTGYWSVFVNNLFWRSYAQTEGYVHYNDQDMWELMLRINDKTENPERPWVTIQNRDGRDQYVYYGNFDWYHYLYRDRHPVQQHNISLSGGNKQVKYYLSAAYDRQEGVMNIRPDVFDKYNLRSKIDFRINKWARLSNNTTFYASTYDFPGISDPEDSFASGGRHAMACFTPQNPDGTWVYLTSWTNYQVNNGRHIVINEGNNVNLQRRSDFTNTAELTLTPLKHLTVKANYTYRIYQSRNTYRRTGFTYSRYPGELIEFSNTGAYEDRMNETVNTVNYHAANVYGTYENTWADAHHLTVTAGYNFETRWSKNVGAVGKNLITKNLSDLALIGLDATGNTITSVSGGQSAYALQGFFGRINYDYKGRYLLEISGRRDGTSRFAKGHRWGTFPSASVGWRISEEPFFAPARHWVDQLKLRASYGELGNQNVSNFAYLQTISLSNLDYVFHEGTTKPKSASISAPNAGDLTWEVARQTNIGLDATLFAGRIDFTAEGFIRNTIGMLTDGAELPAVYGASEPDMNAADLSTRGYELSLRYKDGFSLLGKPFSYSLGANMAVSRTFITKFDNQERTFAKKHYVGKEIGEIWGYTVNDLFKSDEEAAEYTGRVDQSVVSTYIQGGWKAGDMKYEDLDGDNKIGVGSNTVDKPGDKRIIGNSRPRLRYGFNLGFDWLGFDASAFFEGTGRRNWYPSGESMVFWGPYCRPYVTYLPRNFMDNVWAEDNPDAYFPRPRGYIALKSTRALSTVNTRYLQDIRYLRLKNLSVGYTVPATLTRKAGIDRLRVYFSGENLYYWSPLKKHSLYVDPEAAANLVNGDDDPNGIYPWQKTYMFGIDITF